MEEPAARGGGWRVRTSADLSSLLLEVARALKGQRYYTPDHPALRDILDRACLAWQVELERAGTITLSVQGDAVRCDGIDEPQPIEAGLAEHLQGHAIESLRVTPDLTRPGFACFVATLAQEPERLAGDFAQELARLPAGRDEGFEVNAGQGTAPDAESAPGDPPRPTADVEWDDDDGIESMPTELPAEASLGSALLGRSAGPTAPAPPPAVEDKLHLEDDPLRAPAADTDAERLRQSLLRLDGCASDADYADLTDAIVSLANQLADAGAHDDGYRAMLVLSEHASGQGGRSGAQLRIARASLERYARGARLRELIERASASSGNAGVRAAQVLLQLGRRTIAPLLEALEKIREPDRVAQLSAIVVALGEGAQPVLRDAIEHGTPACARVAVQLAGELQSPAMVDTLIETLEGDRPELAREAARALVVSGSEPAVAALAATLSSRREGLPEVAAYCLGSTRGESAVEPLLAALDRATRSRRDDLARACIRALGQLGSDRATPKLAAIVGHKGLLGRRRHRGLKLAALTALAQLPCKEARRAIGRARGSRDRAVREHAKKLTG